MTEEFMTLETAKLLKEKGFDLPVETVFNFDDNSPQQFKLRVNYNNFPSFYSKSGYVKPRNYTLKYPICMGIIGYTIY